MIRTLWTLQFCQVFTILLHDHRACSLTMKQEILLNPFDYCRSPLMLCSRRRDTNLVPLARTCRTFKDPALDVLWEVLEGYTSKVRWFQALNASHSRAPICFVSCLLLCQDTQEVLKFPCCIGNLEVICTPSTFECMLSLYGLIPYVVMPLQFTIPVLTTTLCVG